MVATALAATAMAVLSALCMATATVRQGEDARPTVLTSTGTSDDHGAANAMETPVVLLVFVNGWSVVGVGILISLYVRRGGRSPYGSVRQASQRTSAAGIQLLAAVATGLRRAAVFEKRRPAVSAASFRQTGKQLLSVVDDASRRVVRPGHAS